MSEHKEAQLANLPIDELVDNPRNPNKHPDEQLERLMAELRLDGQTRPLLARAENRMLVTGHGVRLAARKLGWSHIRVLLWDVDQATADRHMLGDNRLGELSYRDDDLVAALLRDIDSTDWLASGYSAAEVDKILGDSKDREIKVYEISADDALDQFWISVRGPMAKQADVLQQIKVLLREFPEVDIDLSTNVPVRDN
jgi:ParB-like chromosome segregation protein Spo0J